MTELTKDSSATSGQKQETSSCGPATTAAASTILGKRLHKEMSSSTDAASAMAATIIETPEECNDDRYIRYADEICANDFVNPRFEELYRDSIDNQAAFFDREAKLVHWHKPYDEVIDTSDRYLHRWFKGGLTNIAYNCLDRHVKAGDGDRVCFFEDSAYTGL